jgi:peptidyl-prolyl cis-trans isomerase C
MSISNSNADATKESETKDRLIVATVNGQPIYKEALAPYTEEALKKFRKYGMKRNRTPELIKRMEQRALDKVIAQELLNQQSRQIKIDDIEKKVEEGIKKIKIKYKTEDKFKNYLASKKLTENELRDNLRRRIYTDTYLEAKGIRNPSIPEEEIRSYYEDSKENYRRDEYIKASHIVILVDENASEEKKGEARKKAEKIRQEIINGKDFAVMAREVSEDGRAANGGELDYITRGFMPPEFDRAAFSLEKDELSEVVQTKFGFHIIKVVDKKPEGIAPLSEVKDFITKFLQMEVSKKKLALHMKELKEKAKIEVLQDES